MRRYLGRFLCLVCDARDFSIVTLELARVILTIGVKFYVSFCLHMTLVCYDE